MKITGGSLAVRAQLSGGEDGGWQEKVNQLRVYSGEKFTAVERAAPGMVVAATGLTHTAPGMGLGAAAGALPPVLEPVLSYRVGLPDGCDAHPCSATCGSSRKRTRCCVSSGTNSWVKSTCS